MVNKIDKVFISGRTLSAAMHLSIWSSLPEKIRVMAVILNVSSPEQSAPHPQF